MTLEELTQLLNQQTQTGFTGTSVPVSYDDIVSAIQGQYTPITPQQFNQQPITQQQLVNTLSGANRFITGTPTPIQQIAEYGRQAGFSQSYVPSAFNINEYIIAQTPNTDTTQLAISQPVSDYLSGNILSNTATSSAEGIGQMSAILGSIAYLTNNTSLYSFAKNLGLMSSIASAETVADTAAILASVALQDAGVPAGAIGLVTSAIKGDTSGMANNAISLASPELAALNAIFSVASGIVGDMPISFGDILTKSGFGQDVFGDVGLIDATQGAKVLSSTKAQDPLGALMTIIGSQTGSDTSQTPTAAATTAANAISVAENIDALDALMQATGAYGTTTEMQDAKPIVDGDVNSQIANDVAIGDVEQPTQNQESNTTTEQQIYFDQVIPVLPVDYYTPTVDYYTPTVDYSVPSTTIPVIQDPYAVYDESDWDYINQQVSNIYNDLSNAEAALGIQVPSYTSSTPVFSGDYYTPTIDYSIGGGATGGTGLSIPSYESVYSSPLITIPDYNYSPPSYQFDYSYSAPSFDFWSF